MPEVDIVPEWDESTYDKVWKAVLSNERYRPVHIGFSEPYDKVAFYLEHGTGPATPGKKEPPRSDGLTARERIGAWVASRDPTLKGAKLRNEQDEMYKRIMETGTAPHPFIRPAIEEVLNEEHINQVFQKNGTMHDIAQEVVIAMVRHLHENDSIRYSVNNDSIEKHIYIRDYGDKEAGERPELSQHDILRDWKAIDDRNYAMHMARLSQYYSEKR